MAIYTTTALLANTLLPSLPRIMPSVNYLENIANQFTRLCNSASVSCSDRFGFKITIIIPRKSIHAKFYSQIRCYRV